MSFTPWANQTFCIPADLAAKAGTLSGLTLAADPQTQNVIVKDAIATGKERLRRKFINQLQRAYPDTNDRLVALANRNVQQALANFYSQTHAAGIDAMATIQWNASIGWTPVFFSNWLLQWNTARPRVFWWAGVPDINAYAGSADIGDFLGNTVDGYIYTNYAVKPAVDWQQFQPEDLIDYVVNPGELKDANTYAAIVACLESVLLRPSTSSSARDTVLQQLTYYKPVTDEVIGACFQNVKAALAGMADVTPWVGTKLNRRKNISIA